jgi:hypothetical protein
LRFPLEVGPFHSDLARGPPRMVVVVSAPERRHAVWEAAGLRVLRGGSRPRNRKGVSVDGLAEIGDPSS